MASLLKKTSDAVNKIFIVFSLVFLVCVAFACTVQVVSRYVFNHSLSWTEEFARYTFIWLTICGTTIATKRLQHAKIDILVALFRGKAKQIHSILVDLAMLVVCGLFFYESLGLLKITSRQLSVAMRIPMSYVYLAVPVGAAGMFIHILSHMVSTVSGDNGISPEGEHADGAVEGETV